MRHPSSHHTVPFLAALTIFVLHSISTHLAEAGTPTVPDVLKTSRSSCAMVVSTSSNAKGTGFFLSDRYVATAFHVVAKYVITGTTITWTIHPDLKVLTASGETLDAKCVITPTATEAEPLRHDFTVLRLTKVPASAITTASLAVDPDAATVGMDVLFSGYPLATPGMVTHKGMLSGHDLSKDVFFIQASINKGNSGGALFDAAGSVIGIVNMREGGISQGLMELSIFIDKSSGNGSVRLMGVDPLQSTRAIIQTLDQFISTGIGYARSIKHLRAYLKKHPLP